MSNALEISGSFISPEKLEEIKSTPEWNSDEAFQAALDQIREVNEKYREMLNEDSTEPQTKYFAVNPVLHALGYVFSIGEDVTIQGETKAVADYTLFQSASKFEEVSSMRGGQGFFREAIGLVQAATWNDPLDVVEDPEAAAQQPMVLLDILLRSSGVDYGIVTNGVKWRLIHRGSSEKYDTYIEMNLLDTLKGELEDFKLFYLFFGLPSFVRREDGSTFIDNMIN